MRNVAGGSTPNLDAPLVSVVMAVHNGAAFLRESVGSILGQDLLNFEFIIINDASTDASLGILAASASADPRIRLQANARQQGLAASLNTGLAMTRGRYIARHDDDDVAMPWRLRVQTEFLERHPEYALCGGMARALDERGRAGRFLDRPAGERRVVDALTRWNVNVVPHPSMMFRNGLGLQYRDRFDYTQDYDFVLNALSRGLRVFNLPQLLLHYRTSATMAKVLKTYRQAKYRQLALRFYAERLRTGSDTYATHDFSPCEVACVEDIHEPDDVAVLMRVMLTAKVSGRELRRTVARAWPAARKRRRMAALWLSSFCPVGLLNAMRRAKQRVLALRKPKAGRASVGVVASLGGGVGPWLQIGSARRELALYEKLCARGWSVTLYTDDRPADVAGLSTPVRVVPGPRVRVPSPLLPLYALVRPLLHYVDGCRHAVVITNQAHSGWPAIVMGRLWHARVIARCGYVLGEQAETMGWRDRRTRARVRSEAWTHRQADLSFIPTPELLDWCARRMPGFDATRARLMPNFVDTALFAPAPERSRDIDVLCVGRLHREKRLDLVLRALALLPGTKLTLVGAGPEQEDLNAQARHLGVPLTVVPRVPNAELPGFYTRSRVYVIASVREGHSKSLVEAMACGCACVGTRSPGIANEMCDGETGLICDATPESLSAALVGLLTDSERRETLGRRARERVETQYSLTRILAACEDALISLITGEGLGPGGGAQ